MLAKIVLVSLLPILTCLLYCATQGKQIGEVYLPGSPWNDELFYFKQVEGIVHYGYPQGYFGFNESHALQLSFAAWSPVLVFPWILWGSLFGWNFMSPIICNILLLTLASALFVYLVKPTWKQIALLSLLFVLYTPFVRYMLSGMPEVICFSLLIVFYGLVLNYLKSERGYKLVLLFLMASLMTLMRPYLILFLFLPMALWVRKSRWKGVLGSLVILGIVGGCYAVIKHELGAEYFAPLFFTEWITTFFTEGFVAGVHNFFATLYYMGRAFMGHTMEGFRSGLASGAFFAGYLVMMAIFLWQALVDWRKFRQNKADQERKALLWVEAHLAFCFVGMLFALLLMYKLTEGSKHLLTFMAAGLFVLSLMYTRTYKKVILMAAVFAYFYSYMAVNPYDYQVPFAEEEREAEIAYWSSVFDEHLSLTGVETGEVPNFDNVVVWVFSDRVEEDEKKSENLKWQVLYSLPEGFGISCCMPEYVKTNLSTMQSRFLTTVSGGEIDQLCMELGYRELGRDQDVVLYERY